MIDLFFLIVSGVFVYCIFGIIQLCWKGIWHTDYYEEQIIRWRD
jgi:hypothetical protein